MGSRKELRSPGAPNIAWKAFTTASSKSSQESVNSTHSQVKEVLLPGSSQVVGF
jgi:hypothetical protein